MSPSFSPSSVVLRAQSDARLISLARSGSEPAFEVLVGRYRGELVTHCKRVLLSGDRAEDATQQTLLAAWSALQEGTEVQHPRAWLHHIAHNRALDARRRAGYDFSELHESLEGGALPEQELERRTVVNRTLTGLAALPEQQREALLRTAVHGESYVDVAAAMSLSEGTVRGMIHRARATLRGAVTAITPTPLIMWAAGSPASDRLVEGTAAAGLGSGGLVAAVSTKLAVATVVAGSAIGGGAIVHQSAHKPEPRAVSSVAPAPRDGGPARAAAVTAGTAGASLAGDRQRRSGGSDHHGSGRGHGSGDGHGSSGHDGSHHGGSSGSYGSSGFSEDGGSSGQSHGGRQDDSRGDSGSGSHHSGGSGSSGGHSGGSSGSGSEGGGDAVDPGSDSSSHDGSGSGSSGSGTSGSGSSGSETSGSETAGSGSSGSGSDSGSDGASGYDQSAGSGSGVTDDRSVDGSDGLSDG